LSEYNNPLKLQDIENLIIDEYYIDKDYPDHSAEIICVLVLNNRNHLIGSHKPYNEIPDKAMARLDALSNAMLFMIEGYRYAGTGYETKDA